jgi:hypothetical protein
MSLASTESFSEGNDETFETFDNFDTIAEEAEQADDDWSKPEPEVKKEKVSEDLKVIKDSQADDKGKVIKEDKDEEDSEDGEEEESEEEAEEEKEIEVKKEEKEEEDKKEEKKDSKKLRMRMGDELFNVDSDASFKVKVDGKTEEVPLQELINNYSGKTAWDKKFTEIGKEKKSLEFEKVNLTKEKDILRTHIKNAIAPLKNKDANPLDSLMYLVEMTGEDPYNAYRRIMEANLEELGQLLDMTETERELHFHKKKDELYSDINKKRMSRQQEEQAFNQALQRVDALRQTYKVSEQQFVDASEELESIYTASGLDVNQITDETIVDYASLKPHIEVVKGLVDPYEDNISEEKYGDVVAELSRYLRDGKADKKAIEQILARNFSVEEDVKELNTKVYSKQAKAPAKKTLKEASEKFESFDDWE